MMTAIFMICLGFVPPKHSSSSKCFIAVEFGVSHAGLEQSVHWKVVKQMTLQMMKVKHSMPVDLSMAGEILYHTASDKTEHCVTAAVIVTYDVPTTT